MSRPQAFGTLAEGFFLCSSSRSGSQEEGNRWSWVGFLERAVETKHFRAGRFLPASDILGNVTSQRQLESHALMGLHHANDPQYKRQQSQKAQQHYTDSETTPMTKATEPPTHAKGHAEHNS